MYKRMILFTIGFTLFVLGVILVISLTGEYKYNNVTVTSESSLKEELYQDLDLDSSYFLFTQTSTVTNRLERLSYIDTYTVTRNLPNLIQVTATFHVPLACDASNLYYVSDVIDLTSINQSLCENRPFIVSSLDALDLVGGLGELSDSEIDRIERLEKIDADTIQITVDGIQILVDKEHISDFLLIDFVEDISEVVDLRRNYA